MAEEKIIKEEMKNEAKIEEASEVPLEEGAVKKAITANTIEETEREVVGKGKAGLTAGTIANFAGENEFDLTKGTSPYEGWGTALKPALEPITVARKPLSEKTVALNVLKWGTGGINIDGCRVGTDSIKINGGKVFPEGGGCKWKEINETRQGRFPANFIWSCSEDEYVIKSSASNKDILKIKDYFDAKES